MMCCELCGCCCMDDLTAEERKIATCVGGYECCSSPIRHEGRAQALKEELALAAEETDESPTGRNFEYEYLTDPDWDGKLSNYDPDDIEAVPGVTYTDARGVTYGKEDWYSDDCPPDCRKCS